MATRTITDQMHRQITVPDKPMRIISLVPSQTELLYDLGLGDRVVGITKFCIHPNKWFRMKTRVGGTKNLNFDIINQLQPDLIIGNKEENEREGIEKLMQHYPVWMSDIKTLDDAKEMIIAIGSLTNSDDKATDIITQIDNSFAGITPLKPVRSALYFIWRKPYMATGTNTFISHMMEHCGFYNAIAKLSGVDSEAELRYPELNDDQLYQINPQYILLSSEPYPFKEKHIEELKAILPNAKILLVDGEMFSWYGSRLTKAGEYFQQLLNSINSPFK